MKPYLSLITLAVADLDRALRFYRDGLGLPTEGIVGQDVDHGAVVFIDLQPGLKLALFPRDNLCHDACIESGSPSPSSMSLAHNVGSPEAVDAVMREAEAAGARIVKPAQPTFWGGHAGYFMDPDGHLWEVAWNPAWPLPE
jgi:catechol 2,3-dioxygenase-like lactoylglutathione lyase family enzyme